LDLANELVEILAKTYLSPNESQILWAVWRKTYCWHKKTDWISFSQFRELTGMIDPNISKILERLIKRKILIRIDKSYSFNKNYDEWISYGKAEVELRKSVIKVTEKRNNNRLLKETILKENIYSERTLRICNDLKIKPTETLEEYISVIYKQYSFKQLVDVLKQWCFENNKKPSGLRLMNWIKRAVEKGELPLWEGEK